MHKFGSLYRNEITKAVRKPVYIVLTALVLASMLLVGIVGLISRLLDASGAFYYQPDVGTIQYEIEWNESQYESMTETFDAAMKEIETHFSGAKYNEGGSFDAELALEDYRTDFPGKLSWPVNELYFNARRVESYKLLSESEDDSGDVAGFIGETREKLASIKACERVKKDVDELLGKYPLLSLMAAADREMIYGGENYYGEEYSFRAGEALLKYKANCEKILAEESFDEYIALSDEVVRSNDALSESQKKISLETNAILKKLYRPDMTQTEWNEVTSALNSLNSNKMLLDSGTDWNGDKLSASTVEKYKLQIEEITKGLEYGAPGYGGRQSKNENTFLTVAISVGAAVSQVLIIVMGALLIAEEIQSGSVKLLIIAPVKRIKIFSAKLLMLATACAVEMLLVYVTLMFVCLFSGLGFSNMVFTFAGSVHVMNPFLYYFIYVLLTFVEIFAAGVFALLLSTLIRNVGGAISISMVVMYVLDTWLGTIMMLVIGFSRSYVFQNIYRVLPGANSGLPAKLFASSIQDNYDLAAILTGDFGMSISNGFLISLLYITGFSALFIWASYESFIKRDIK